MNCVVTFFFFQAEDGIRDLVRSRGLGDVYKRQPLLHPDDPPREALRLMTEAETAILPVVENGSLIAVSYTHLTLPTIYSV